MPYEITRISHSVISGDTAKGIYICMLHWDEDELEEPMNKYGLEPV